MQDTQVQSLGQEDPLQKEMASNLALNNSDCISLNREQGTYANQNDLRRFYTIHEVLGASILGWFAIPSSSGSHFVRTLCYDLSVLGSLAWHCS